MFIISKYYLQSYLLLPNKNLFYITKQNLYFTLKTNYQHLQNFVNQIYFCSANQLLKCLNAIKVGFLNALNAFK